MGLIFHHEFKDGKNVSGRVGIPFPFTRTSEGTQLNSAGQLEVVAAGIPRFRHDPDGTSRGIMLETARTNLAINSQTFNAAGWSTGAVSLDYDYPDPMGGNDAVRVTSTSSGTTANYRQIIQSLTAVDHISSLWVRRVSGTGSIRLYVGKGTSMAASTIPLTTEWQRFDSDVVVPNGTNDRIGIGAFGANGDVIEVFGVQIEAGDYSTSYIPTGASTVTRTNDNLTNLTAADFGFNGNEGTLVVVGTIHGAPATTSYTVSGTGANSRLCYRNGSGLNMYDGTTVTGSQAITVGDGLYWTFACAWSDSENKQIAYRDGVSSDGAEPHAANSFDTALFCVGKNSAESNRSDFTISSIRVYDEFLEDELPDMSEGIYPPTAQPYLAITRRTASQMRPKQRTKQPRSTIRGFFD